RVAGPDLHLLAIWDAQTLLYAQGPDWPGEREPWPALYRVGVHGGEPERLADNVYRLVIRRQHDPADPPALVAYLTSEAPGPPTLRTTGRVWLGRPEGTPVQVVPADPPLVLQPLMLSPDQRYLLSYGWNPDPAFFSIDLSDLSSATSRRIAFALAASVPRWLGFDGPGARYLLLPNLEGLRPYALFRLEEGALPVSALVLPGRVGGLLPDGRGVLEGPDLRAKELRRDGAEEVLAQGPVGEQSSFVAGGAAYFLRTLPGAQGPLVRAAGGQAVPISAPAAEVFFVGAGGRAAYLGGARRQMRAVVLPDGPEVELTAEAVRAYRPLPGGGVLVWQMAQPGVIHWAPGQPGPTGLSATAVAAWPAGADRFAVLEVEGPGRVGVLRLLHPNGQPVAGIEPVPGVDLVDATGHLLAYSVPQGPAAGIWIQRLP
ncbi:MAG: hypothetical protein RMK29_16375, partial [Myxococcales bacterium]|nr:hypothetical protein [Myxococcales bacterium]